MGIPRVFCIARIESGVVKEYCSFIYNDLEMAQKDCDSLNGAYDDLKLKNGWWEVGEFGRPAFIKIGGNKAND